jgi:hypothetical protein
MNLGGGGQLTGEIQVLEQDPILMIPSFAHVHTVWFIQLGELGWCISHECLRFYSPHGLPLPRLDLGSLLVHASPDLILSKNLATFSFVVWGSCCAIGGSIAIFVIGEAGCGCAAIFGGCINSLGFVLEGIWIVGLQRARQFPEWLLEERHFCGGVLGRELIAGKAVFKVAAESYFFSEARG